MHESIHIEVTKGDFGASGLAMESDIWVGEDSFRVIKEVIQKIVLQVNTSERFAVVVLYSKRLSVAALWSAERSNKNQNKYEASYPAFGIGRVWSAGCFVRGWALEECERRSAV